MSVNPISIDNDTVTLVDEFGHTNTIALADINFIINLEGQLNYRIISLTCTTCGTTSVHPMGGGAAPAQVQELFVRLVALKGCPCGLVVPGQPMDLAKSHVKKHADNMDGKGRFKLDEVTIE